VAGVALGDLHLRFAWPAWHLGHWAGSGGAFCVAGVALGDIHLCVAWQAWHLVTCVAGVALAALSHLSFLPSLTPLQHLLLIFERSWLVGLSGPLI